jgi:hypothetical protein
LSAKKMSWVAHPFDSGPSIEPEPFPISIRFSQNKVISKPN